MLTTRNAILFQHVDHSSSDKNTAGISDELYSANIIYNICHLFHLRPEQRQAFIIVASHAEAIEPKQLLLYLGGMAGTGKSQIVKALRHFFDLRGEAYRLEVSAPTGSAAVLIGRSTYHSLLGFREREDRGENTFSLPKVKERSKRCSYILIDEVSMVSCKALHIMNCC